MPRLTSSEWRWVHSRGRAWVSVVWPWSTWPIVPMLTSGCLGTFMRHRCRSLLGRRGGRELGDGLGAVRDDLRVDLRDVWADLSPVERDLLALPGVVLGAVADALGHEDLLAVGRVDLGSHGEAVLVRAAGDDDLVAREAQEHAVDLVADLLAD